MKKNIYQILNISEYSDAITVLKEIDKFLNGDTTIKEWSSLRNEFSKIIGRSNITSFGNIEDGLYSYDKTVLLSSVMSEKYYRYKHTLNDELIKENINSLLGMRKYVIVKSSLFYMSCHIFGNFEKIKYNIKLSKRINSKKNDSYVDIGPNGYFEYKNGKLIDRKLTIHYIKEDEDRSIDDIARKIGVSINDIECYDSDIEDIPTGREIIVHLNGIEASTIGDKYIKKQDYEKVVKPHYICNYTTDKNYKSIKEEIILYILENYPGFRVGKEYNKNAPDGRNTSEDWIEYYLYLDNPTMYSQSNEKSQKYEVYFYGTDKEYYDLVERKLLPIPQSYFDTFSQQKKYFKGLNILSFFSYNYLGDNMKKIFVILFILLIIPIKVNAYSLGASAVLMEEDTKRVLVSKNMNKKMLIASTTKIMTAVLAIESGKMNKMVTVTDKVLESYGSNIYLSVGEKMKLEDMVYGLMMQSGNDAALMIADYLGGEEKFVNKMNEKAKKIGMKNTVFSNPHGLDEKNENISTAYDMAILMRYANSYDKFKKITGCKKHTVKTNDKTYSWRNKNKLLYTYKYTTGGKTGFTKKARRTLVTSASKDNMNLIVVTLNDGNDFKNHKELYEYGFNNYSMEKIFNKNKLNLENKNIYAVDDYYYPITKKEKELITIEYNVKDKKKYKNNEKIGKAIIKLSGKIIHEEPLYIKVK